MGLRFFTDTGLEVPAVTTEQMIEVDRIAVAAMGPNLFQMMENAGRNLALQAIDCLGDHWQQSHIVVLAGSGGNGGGGICAARHLANRGARVTLCVSAAEARLTDVTRWQRHVVQGTATKELDIADLLVADVPVDLIIDALIGYRLHAAPRGNAQQLIHWANITDAPILSLDVPSGVNATTGKTPGEVIRAHWTMTLALPKTGLWPGETGELWLADIGIPPEVYRQETLALKYTPPFGKYYRIRIMARSSCC
ncbi:MAG: NAD(P)H-hydrate epimerase [Leptolyngbya sp. SIO3F4]|nr:NAD(P)H-hydrate epimerase [Leptolyngbya sp. SIO3F4]